MYGQAMEVLVSKSKIKSYRDLLVWQKSMDLVVEIYALVGEYPKSELFGLVSQMKRSAISIPSNIAEGSKRSTRKDYRNFLIIAHGSGAELETQIELSRRVGLLKDVDKINKISHSLDEIMKMLGALIVSLDR